MKFFPAVYDEPGIRYTPHKMSTPFCSGGRHTPHKVSRGPGFCEECGVDGLVTENSDHMYTTAKKHVLLCLPCAADYKALYGLTTLVPA